jgi:hypothetical protein
MHKKREKNMDHPVHHKSIEDKIVENLVELQKVHANLAEKFDKLSNQISTLLTLFEVSAKSIVNSSGSVVSEKDKEFINKIDKLLDQNKLIAKGLTLVEGKMREKVYGTSSIQAPTPAPISMQTKNPGMGPTEPEEELNDYQPMTPSIKAPDVPRPLPKY